MTPRRSAVALLAAQAVAFGIMAALLGVVANALFLEEYGSRWLPVTYLAIGAAGIVVSGLVARSARSGELVTIATTVLSAGVVALVAAWVVAAAGGAWVSAPLLVLFPVLIQLGFVFIGAQAGRLLDIAALKAEFPRIVAGFPAGAVVGGVLAGPLIDVTGGTEHLVAATAVAQAAFVGMVVVTGRRFSATLAPGHTGARSTEPTESPRPALWRLLGRPFVLLIVAYQLLSAVGSQLADFLVFDRAAARYTDSEDLARFVARYTAVMNVASIVFLTLVAGALLRRYGLRAGLPANPAVLAVFAGAMVVAGGAAGVGSFALLLAASAARIADIALTDGTTRTAINTTYQVLPPDEQLPVQTSVEGVGVPVAIAASGLVVIVLDATPFATEALIATLAVTCLVWTWVAVALSRGYTSALVDALARRRVLEAAWQVDGDAGAAERAAAVAMVDGDGDARFGVEVLAAFGAPAVEAELRRVASDPRPEVRRVATEQLAAAGDAAAIADLRESVRSEAVATDPRVRHRAAVALAVLERSDRVDAAQLLVDPDVEVRLAAIRAVREGDRHAIEPVLAALSDHRTRGAAAAAVARLGVDVAPAVHASLAADAVPASPASERLVRALRLASPAVATEVLAPHLRHRDRRLGLAVLTAVAGPDPAAPAMASDLDRLLADDLRHADEIGAAAIACADVAPAGSPLHRALSDERALVRERVGANLRARHGTRRLGEALLAVDTDGRRHSLAVETLEVTLPRGQAAAVLHVLAPDDRTDLPADVTTTSPEMSAALTDMVADPDDRWRSPWLRACALHAALLAGIELSVDRGVLRSLDDPLVDELLGS